MSFYRAPAHYSPEASFAAAIAAGRMSAGDEALIREYISEKEAAANLSPARARHILFTLIAWRRFLTAPYAAASMADIYEAITALRNGTSIRGRPYKQNSIHEYIAVLKAFLLWCIDNEYSALPRKKIRAIRGPGADYETTAPSDILTVDEIAALIRGAKSSRDRAFIATLYESAGRIAEVVRLRWSDLAFDKHGVRAYLDDTKTKKTRYVRLTLAAEYLAAWKGDCPDLGGRVFIQRGGGPMTYLSCIRVISRAAERAGIVRKIHPHLFRTSRITHMIAQNYQESVIKESCWGNLDTGMLKTYIRLRESDIDREFLKRAGVTLDEESDTRRLDRPCPRCHALIGPTFDFCPKCAQPLSPGATDEYQAMLSSVLDHPDIIRDLIEEKRRREERLTRR